MKFEELNIPTEILSAIQHMGFTEATTIQEKSIPPSLEGKDIIAGSATGSGKTLAFGVSLINGSQRGKGIQSIVLTPTRELAEQVMNSLKKLSKFKQLRIEAIYGGVSINPQFHALETADIVVGTPGRVLDHLERRTINLTRVKYVVLDEADRMLDMGFLEDVTKIISQCPKERQTLLFSATMPPEIVHLSQRFMNSPIKIRAENQVDPTKLHQVYYDISNSLKFSLLVHLLNKEEAGLVMVFCNSRRTTDVVAKSLNKAKIDAMAIHGGLTQAKRNQVLSKFNSNKAFVLVCTDVAARGLDIQGVSHVYNYDLPPEAKQYVHRIGRTARAGSSGKAVNLVSDRDHENFGRILREYSIDVKKIERPAVEKIPLAVVSSGDSRGRFGGNNRGPRNTTRGNSVENRGRYGGRSSSQSSNRNRQDDSRDERPQRGRSGSPKSRFQGRKSGGQRRD